MNDTPKGDYAGVNGLNMYYETHGPGQPLVLLHGAYMAIDAMRELVLSLAEPGRSSLPSYRGMGTPRT